MMDSNKYREIVKKAKLADYGPVHGNIVLLPYGLKIWKRIKKELSYMLDATSHEQVCLPLLIPEKFITDEKDYVTGLSPRYFSVVKTGEEKEEERLAIRPTSETVACYMFEKWVASYRDLPIKVYQWANIARWEANTQPFIKETEIQWLEGHTIHAYHREALEEINTIIRIFKMFLTEKLLFPVSVGTEPKSRKFAGSLSTVTFEALTPSGRALQLAAVYDLGQIFTEHFQVRYRDSDNDLKICWMTDWGLGFRLIGALILLHGDDRGLRLPPAIAPVQVMILELNNTSNCQKQIHEKALLLQKQLNSLNIRTEIESCRDKRFGYVIQEWEWKGVPVAILIGKNEIEKNEITLRRRDQLDVRLNVATDQVAVMVAGLLPDISRNLYEETLSQKKSHILVSDNYDQMISWIENNWVMAGWCGSDECEDKIVRKEGKIIRYVEIDKDFLNKHAFCIACRKKATVKAVFAKNF